MKGYLTTKQAAKILGVTPSRVRQFIMEGRLKSVKFGRDNVIKKKDLAAVMDRKPGRPAADK